MTDDYDDDLADPNWSIEGRRSNAERGSERLLQAIQRMFHALERRHGLLAGEAQTLLLDTGLGRLGASR